MSVLADKIRKSRESQVQAGGFSFTIRRPTDMDMLEFNKVKTTAFLIKFVVGWDGVTELDLIPGGDGHPAHFDEDACAEWFADRPDLMVPVVNAIVEAYQSHKSKVGEAEKK